MAETNKKRVMFETGPEKRSRSEQRLQALGYRARRGTERAFCES